MSGDTHEGIHLGEPVRCGWFALCTRETDIAVEHPVLGPTPVCLECADRVGMELSFPNAVVHHLAFRLSEAVPICGHTLTGDGLSLEADKVTCGLCRRICELDVLA